MAFADPFRPQGRTELFADSTPCDVNPPIRMERLAADEDDFAPTASLRRMRASGGNVPVALTSNPAAGTMHNNEKGKPWKTYWEARVAKDEEKAQAEQRDKRLWGLAKQATAGLQQSFGIAYGVAEMKTVIQLAFDEIEEDAEDRTEPAATIYKAVLKHDMALLAQALEQDLRSSDASMAAYSRTVNGKSMSVHKSSLADVHNPSFPKGLGKVQ